MLVMTVALISRGYLAKTLILGSKNVGKTTFRRRLSIQLEGYESIKDIVNDFDVGFGSRTFFVRGKTITVQFWELASHEGQVPHLPEMYMEAAHMAFILCDVTNIKSIESIPYLVTDFWAYNGRGIQPIMILLNKADLLENWNQIKKLASFDYRDWIDFLPEMQAECLIDVITKIEPVLNRMGLNLGFTPCSALKNHAIITSARFLLKELLNLTEYQNRRNPLEIGDQFDQF